MPMALEYHHISGTTGFYRKLHINFEDNTEYCMLVLCFLRPELVFLRLRWDKQTNNTQTDYRNPSAHARRGLIYNKSHVGMDNE